SLVRESYSVWSPMPHEKTISSTPWVGAPGGLYEYWHLVISNAVSPVPFLAFDDARHRAVCCPVPGFFTRVSDESFSSGPTRFNCIGTLRFLNAAHRQVA
ncbi:MAG TPA: hypothetical protein VHY59_12155, partial [Chthoniobacterales bacterium]|nr:hypothetical protein [Chthoniobacterales bacterium]